MSTTNLNSSDRAADIMEDIANYIAALVADGYHDRWELWTAKIDTVSDELRELADIIAVLESESKQRLLTKIDKKLLTVTAHGYGSRWPLTAT